MVMAIRQPRAAKALTVSNWRQSQLVDGKMRYGSEVRYDVTYRVYSESKKIAAMIWKEDPNDTDYIASIIMPFESDEIVSRKNFNGKPGAKAWCDRKSELMLLPITVGTNVGNA